MSSKKSSTTQNQSFNTTTTPTNPDWVTSGVQGLMGGIDNLSGSDIPGASALQNQAFQQASGLQSGADQYAPVMAALNSRPTVEAQSLLTNLQDYMSPYTQDVVNTTLADFDANAGATRAAQAAKGAASQAFGGSRWGVQEAATEGQLARARATADAQLRDQGFQVGAGLSGQDADRRQSASAQNASNALSAIGLLSQAIGGAQNADVQNIGLLSNLGGTQRDIESQQSPLGVLSAQTGLLSQLPLNLFSGSNSSGSSNSSGKSSSSGIGFTWDPTKGFGVMGG